MEYIRRPCGCISKQHCGRDKNGRSVSIARAADSLAPRGAAGRREELSADPQLPVPKDKSNSIGAGVGKKSKPQ